jgi:hypothetical protein
MSREPCIAKLRELRNDCAYVSGLGGQVERKTH